MSIKFRLANDRLVSNMTSNITHLLSRDDQTVLLADVTPDFMQQTFGASHYPGFSPGDYEYDCKGYTDDEWYFKGPGDVVLGIGFRWGQPRLRGKNLDNQFLTEQELCSKFMEFLAHSYQLAGKAKGSQYV